LFFALWPDAAVRAELDRWGAALHARCGGRRIRADKLHATLAFVGDTPDEAHGALHDAAAAVDTPGFDVVLDAPGYWKHNRIAWAGASAFPIALSALAEKLRAGLAARGVHFDPKPFVTHVTLLRDARPPAQMPALPPIRWPVSGFSLVRSAGGRYELLSSWPLS
jgi:2'-5' RNA ligase